LTLRKEKFSECLFVRRDNVRSQRRSGSAAGASGGVRIGGFSEETDRSFRKHVRSDESAAPPNGHSIILYICKY
jgi:hypothetical protein